MLMLVFLAVGVAGCFQPPPVVTMAHDKEKEAIEVFVKDVNSLTGAYHDHLAAALEKQTELIFKYEWEKLVDKDGKVDAAAAKTLFDGMLEARKEDAQVLGQVAARVASAQRNADAALVIHDSIKRFMNRKTITPEDVDQFIGHVEALYAAYQANKSAATPAP